VGCCPRTRPHRERLATRPAKRQCGCSSHWPLIPFSCSCCHDATLQHHRLPSVTTTVTNQRGSNVSRVICPKNKRCMLVSSKPGADFLRWCALPVIGHSIFKTHPPIREWTHVSASRRQGERDKPCVACPALSSSYVSLASFSASTCLGDVSSGIGNSKGTCTIFSR
jgi:hypothetical protein